MAPQISDDILTDIFIRVGVHQWRNIAPVCKSWATIIRHCVDREIRLHAEELPTLLNPLCRPLVTIRAQPVPWIELIKMTAHVAMMPKCECERPDIVKLMSHHFDRPNAILTFEKISADELILAGWYMHPCRDYLKEVNPANCVIWASVEWPALTADIIEFIISQSWPLSPIRRWPNDGPRVPNMQTWIESVIRSKGQFGKFAGVKPMEGSITRAIYLLKKLWFGGLYVPLDILDGMSADVRDVIIAIVALLITAPEYIQNFTNGAKDYVRAIQRPATRKFVMAEWNIAESSD